MKDDNKEFEERLYGLERQVLVEVTSLKKDVQSLTSIVQQLVTRAEFAPVKSIAFGLAGGVLLSALGATLAKLLGW